MPRTSHVVTPGINDPANRPPLRACAAWRIAPITEASGLAPGVVPGVFPVVVRLAAAGADLLAQPITIDNDGWQTVPTGPGWNIESVSRTAVEAAYGHPGNTAPNDSTPVAYLVECVDDVHECGQVNTRSDDVPPAAAENTFTRTGAKTYAAGDSVAQFLAPRWARRLAVVVSGDATGLPALSLVNADAPARPAADVVCPAPASLPTHILVGHSTAYAPTGGLLLGATPVPPLGMMRLTSPTGWTLPAGKTITVTFRWSR